MLAKSNFEKFIEGNNNFLRENDLNVLFNEDFKSENNEILSLYKLPYKDIFGVEHEDIIVYYNLDKKPVFVVDDENIYVLLDIFKKFSMRLEYTLVKKLNYYNIYSAQKMYGKIIELINEINNKNSLKYVNYLYELGEKEFLNRNEEVIAKSSKEEVIYDWVKNSIISSSLNKLQNKNTISNEIHNKTFNLNRIGKFKNSKFHNISTKENKLFSVLVLFKNNLEELKHEFELDFHEMFKTHYGVEPLAMYFSKMYEIYSKEILKEISKDFFIQKVIKIKHITDTTNSYIVINGKHICFSKMIIEWDKLTETSCFFEELSGDLIFVNNIETIVINGKTVFDNKEFTEIMDKLNEDKNSSYDEVPF
ncbi:hypothetical protein [Clostridium perfringens]|uniref:Uncharacterized protein n=1 Tax=Clostridium perfringens TaxID=1502 RepID=A0A140GRV1_CLOPF|nr:hypothetical protein [Clostridium perfringens]AMN31260.1 hypothetical protein JFP838_pA0344 [Clostridium perfringens]